MLRIEKSTNSINQFKNQNRPIKKKKNINKKNLIPLIKAKLQKRNHFTNKIIQLKGRQKQHMEARTESELQEATNKNFRGFLKEKTEGMSCPICRMEVIEPAVISCGHTFCLECLELSLLMANSCPMCRSVVWNEENYGVGFSTGVYNFQKSPKKKSYEEEYRVKEYYNWKKMRFVTADQIIETEGLKVDVWCGSSKWRKAKIVDKFMNSEKQLVEIMVSYENQIQSNNEIINFQPLKIAKYGFYSSFKGQNAQFGNQSVQRMIPFGFGNFSTQFSQMYNRNNLNLEYQSTGTENQFNERPLIRGLEGSQQAEDFLLRPSERTYLEDPTFMIRRVDSQVLDDSEENVEALASESPEESDDGFLECEQMDDESVQTVKMVTEE